jgi:hypothetical protein
LFSSSSASSSDKPADSSESASTSSGGISAAFAGEGGKSASLQVRTAPAPCRTDSLCACVACPARTRSTCCWYITPAVACDARQHDSKMGTEWCHLACPLLLALFNMHSPRR